MSKRRPLIAGNWKMYKPGEEAVETAQSLSSMVAGVSEVDIMVAPPFTAIHSVARVLAGSPVAVGAQNLHWEKEGAFTGEIAPAMLVAAGCRYVIIGHSERRQYFGETDETVNRKVRAALDNNLIPVMCIGETEKERDSNLTLSVLDKQVQKGLEGFSQIDLAPLVIAYEPIWAIGTGKTATTDQAQEVHRFIREVIGKTLGEGLANSLRILYGGSVKPNNIAGLMKMADIDGALVGGASLNPETFSKIVKFQ